MSIKNLPEQMSVKGETITSGATGIGNGNSAKAEVKSAGLKPNTLSSSDIIETMPDKLKNDKGDTRVPDGDLKKSGIIDKGQYNKDALSELSSIKDSMSKLGVQQISESAGKPSLPEKDNVKNGIGR